MKKKRLKCVGGWWRGEAMQKVVQEITLNQRARIRDWTLTTEGSKKKKTKKQEEGNMIWDDVCDGAVTRRSDRKRNKRTVCSAPPRPCAQSVTEGSAAIHPVPLAQTPL